MTSKHLVLSITATMLVSACNHRQLQPVMKPVMLSQNEQHGQVVYMQHCQPCHPQGEGASGWPLPQIPVPGVAYRFRIRDRAFALGLGKMPAFKKDKISRQELDDLVAYLKRTRKNNQRAGNVASR